MKRLMVSSLLSLSCVVFFSCYHARIETGLPASLQVINKSFASGWIYGLVPPSTVKAASERSRGVAVVETQLSFVNQLVSALTLGIYTPMHIRVTCASASSMGSVSTKDDLIVAGDASDEEVVGVFEMAAKKAVQQQEPVLVRFVSSATK